MSTSPRFTVTVTAPPSPRTIEATRALLAGAACTAANEAVLRGAIVPADYERFARALGERLVATLADGTPTDERTARMIVAAVRAAGGCAEAVARTPGRVPRGGRSVRASGSVRP